jgi:hypothetical protein
MGSFYSPSFKGKKKMKILILTIIFLSSCGKGLKPPTEENKKMTIYQKEGYTDRNDYLNSLADTFDLPIAEVKAIALILGESEDFDGLVTTVQDRAGY